MAYANVNHRFIHKLESKTVGSKLCAAVAGMAIVGQNQDLYYLKSHAKTKKEPEEKQPMVLSRVQNWIDGSGTTTHHVIKTSSGSYVKAAHANGLTYYRKPGDSTGLFYIATGNHLKGNPKSKEAYIGPQVIVVTANGEYDKKIYYNYKINSIAYYDTCDGFPRFVIGVGAKKPDESDPPYVTYTFQLVRLVGDKFVPLLTYKAPTIDEYRDGNDIYCSDGKLYVTVFKKKEYKNNPEKHYIYRNKIIPFDLSSHDNMASETNPPTVTIKKVDRDLIDDRDTDKEISYEIEGMSIGSKNKKYVCTNRRNKKDDNDDGVYQLYAE